VYFLPLLPQVRHDDPEQLGLPLRANALKLLAEHHLEKVVGVQGTGEALARQTLRAGLLT
jgi:hypothetical protein